MPEPRPFPKFLPRLRKHISVNFAPPLDPALLHVVLDPWRNRALSASEVDVPLGAEDVEKEKTRSELTAVIQREVEKLGRAVSGPLLGGKPL